MKFLKSIYQSVILLLLSSVYNNIVSQPAAKVTKGLKKEILFTLRPSEEVYPSEYIVNIEMAKDNFSAIIVDTNSQTGSFIFNGKRIVDGVDGPYRPIEIHYINHNQANGFAFEYSRNKSKYVNVKGINYGPYYSDKTYNDFNRNSENIIFSYKEKDSHFYYVNANGLILGPYEGDNSYYDIKKMGYREDGSYRFCYKDKNITYTYSSEKPNKISAHVKPCTWDRCVNMSYGDSVYMSNSKYNGGIYNVSFFHEREGDKIFSTDNLHYLKSNYDQVGVIVDGNLYGRSPALEAYYSALKKAFIWLVLEDKKLIKYTYYF